MWCVIGTLPRLFLEPTAKAMSAGADVLRKIRVLGISGIIFVLVRVLLV